MISFGQKLHQKTHWIVLVLQEAVSVFNNDIIFKADQLGNLFGYPFSEYRDVDFAQVHLTVRNVLIQSPG